MWSSRVKSLDMHVKTLDGVTKQTLLGATMTIVAVITVLILFLSEVANYTSPHIVGRMQADVTREDESVNLHFDIDFMEVSCHQINFSQEVVRGQVHEHEVKDEGIRIKDKVFSEDGAPETNGCNIYGSLITDKIAGNFVFKVVPESTIPSPRIADMQKNSNFSPEQKAVVMKEMQQLPRIPVLPPLTHRINHMVFLPTEGIGSNLEGALSAESDDSNSIRHILKGKGLENEVSLLNTQTVVSRDDGLYHYNIQVIPMHYKPAGTSVHEQILNQYSVSERGVNLVALSEVGGVNLAGQTFMDTFGVVFTYDFYPLVLGMEEQSSSLFDFLSSLVGIIGGIITVIGLLERFLGSASKAVLGKKD